MDTQIFEKYAPKDKSSLIAILQDIQGQYGYLPEKVLMEVSDYVGMPLSRIYGVATFYNQFRLTPLGQNVIRVCRGTACHVRGSLGILERLGVEVGPRLVVEGRAIEAFEVAIGGFFGGGVGHEEIEAQGLMARGHESGSHWQSNARAK